MEISNTQSQSQRSETSPQRPHININESPLMRLYMRRDHSGKRLIDTEQYIAGERLRVEFEMAMLSPRTTMAYRQPVAFGSTMMNGIENLTETAIEMRDRVNAAFVEVGPELSGILWNVVCMAAGLEHAERVLALPVRSGKVVLTLALDRLARHYGLKARLKPRAREIGAWHTEDFRPVILVQAPALHPT